MAGTPEPRQDLIGTVNARSIVAEVEQSYLDYAMSVIVARALPDVRDGLKPVHRRILYAMWQIGLRPSAKFRKCATVVGEVLGKYHPHGDSAVYDSLVRLAQDFSMRNPLVHGQGNFGSMDGDSAAAMRYTEAKLTHISEELLLDLEKDTVEFVPNYDGSHKEPRVLPARLPNLLINGSVGIAVGMATNIPPHNLTEVCQAVEHLLDNPTATVPDLMEFIKGPDFPTGGIIYNVKDIEAAYTTGRGGIVVRAKAEIVEDSKGAFSIIINEIPYLVNKATMIEKIADLVKEKIVEGIKDLRDESNKEGVRVVIDLKKDAYPKKVLNQLYKLTQMQTAFHVNLLALVDGLQPRVLNLKMVLEEYVKHREEVVRRRTQYDLDRALERAHILEGLMIALSNIDAVIKVIKASKDREDARTNLMGKFTLSEIQANAILDMRLQNLANLERLKIENELTEKRKFIKECEAILGSVKKMRSIIKDEVVSMREQFGDARRTQIIKHGIKEFSTEDLIPNSPAILMITQDNYIKRIAPDTFKLQHRGGKGVIGVTTKEEDSVESMITTSTHADLLFFTSRGRVFQTKAYDIPESSRTARGQALVNFLQLAPNEKVSAVLALNAGISDSEIVDEDVVVGADKKYIIMVTRKGTMKKVDLSAFANVRRSGIIAISLHDDDELTWVRATTGTDEVTIVTAQGMSIRFEEKGIRAMGRTAAGVRGMRLHENDFIVGMDVTPSKLKEGEYQLFVVTKNGFGKRTDVTEYRLQSRGGSGTKTANVKDKTGDIVSARVVRSTATKDVILISEKGQVIRVTLATVSVLGRATQGVRLMRFKEAGDVVASVTIV
ncbi:MAG: DNA gyrase subunit A [Patescibacteria group bacterium]